MKVFKVVATVAVVLMVVGLLLAMGGCGEKKYRLTISVSPSGGGTTSPEAGTDKYEKYTLVTILATPASGYQFVNWTGDASGTFAATTVTMDSDKTVTANFSQVE